MREKVPLTRERRAFGAGFAAAKLLQLLKRLQKDREERIDARGFVAVQVAQHVERHDALRLREEVIAQEHAHRAPELKMVHFAENAEELRKGCVLSRENAEAIRGNEHRGTSLWNVLRPI